MFGCGSMCFMISNSAYNSSTSIGDACAVGREGGEEEEREGGRREGGRMGERGKEGGREGGKRMERGEMRRNGGREGHQGT